MGAGFDEAYWNLLQVVAWVYVGDRALVGKLSDRTNDHGTFWQQLRMPDQRLEWVETHADKPGPIHVISKAASLGGSAEPSFEEAENTIMVALQRGVLTASGVRDGTDERVSVPAEDWGNFQFSYEPDAAVPRPERRTTKKRWFDLEFRRDDVLALWPDPLATSARIAELRAASAKGMPTTAYISVVEALTWVAHRQVVTPADFVRSANAPFLEDAPRPFGLQLLALKSKPGQRTSEEIIQLGDLAAAEANQHAYFERLKAAEQEIFEACRAERITLLGKKNADDAKWVDIPPRYFLNAVAIYLADDRIMLDYGGPPASWYNVKGAPQWHEVKAKRSEILAEWPAETPARSGVSTSAGERQCQRWLEGLMRESGPIKAKKAYLEEAQSQFDVSKKGFARAWANAVAITGNTAWSRPGRKSGKQIDTPS